jgi:hypothetical protein
MVLNATVCRVFCLGIGQAISYHTLIAAVVTEFIALFWFSRKGKDTVLLFRKNNCTV